MLVPFICNKGSCKHLRQSSPTNYQAWVGNFGLACSQNDLQRFGCLVNRDPLSSVRHVFQSMLQGGHWSTSVSTAFSYLDSDARVTTSNMISADLKALQLAVHAWKFDGPGCSLTWISRLPRGIVTRNLWGLSIFCPRQAALRSQRRVAVHSASSFPVPLYQWYPATTGYPTHFSTVRNQMQNSLFHRCAGMLQAAASGAAAKNLTWFPGPPSWATMPPKHCRRHCREPEWRGCPRSLLQLTKQETKPSSISRLLRGTPPLTPLRSWRFVSGTHTTDLSSASPQEPVKDHPSHFQQIS